MAEAITKNVHQVWWQAANAPWMLHRTPFQVAPHRYSALLHGFGRL